MAGSGFFDDIPAPALSDGSVATPAQAQTAAQLANHRDPNARAGSADNPSYDTASRTGDPNSYHVTQGGALAPPVTMSGFFDDLPLSQVSKLADTPAMHAALAADAARNPKAVTGDALKVVDGFTFGRAPEFDALAQAGDVALDNALRRITGRPVQFGAADAYKATKAADQDRIAAFDTLHPTQSALATMGGSAVNPVNILTAGALGDTLNGARGTGALMRLASATGKSAGIGGAEGALYGSADPNDPMGGAERGAVAGFAGGAAAVPAAAALSGAARGLVSGTRTMINGPQATLGDALSELTPAQIQAVQAMRQDAAQRGINLTIPEAVQQVTNNGTALGRMQRVLEGTKQGEQLLAPYFADRTAQVQGAVRDFADRVAEPTSNPSELGPRAQVAAQRGLDQVREWINEQAGPHYRAMAGAMQPDISPGGGLTYVPGPGTTIPLDEYQALARNGAYGDALANVRGNPRLNAGIAHLPDHDVSVVNEVVKELDRLGTATAQTATNPTGNNFIASQYGNARGLADRLATRYSPQWAAARGIERGGHQWLTDPLEAGPVGQTARSGTTEGALGAVYPSKPLAGGADETDTAMRVLQQQHPGLPADLTRQHILTSLDNSRPELSGGPNPYLGPSFAVKVAGTPERQASLMAGVRQIGPNGEAAADDLGRLLETLRATGKRQPAGSKTAFNESDLADWHVPPVARALESFSIAEPLEPLAQILKTMNYRRNVRGLSDFMTAPADETAARIMAAQGAAPEPVMLRVPQLPYNTAGLPFISRPSGSSPQQ